MVVGEGPGYNEVKEGRPFSPNGVSGRKMERALRKHCGLSRADVHWTNAVLCDVAEKDLAKARKCCQARLTAELAETGCPIVLAVGAYGLQSSIGASKKPAILRFRGAVIEPDDPVRSATKGALGAIVIGTVHPAFVARSPLWEPIFEADIARAGRVMRDGFVPPEKLGRIVVATTIEQLEELLPALDKEIVVDIETVETTGVNKGRPDIHTNNLTCFVLADTKLSVVIPWSRTRAGDGLYWNGRSPDVIKLVNETMGSRVVTTHNGPAYDHIGLARRGVGPAWCGSGADHSGWDDTLLAYHVVTSCFPKSLEHVAACYIDAPPWKKWPHDVSLEELWQYCGRDGLYTARVKQALFATMDASDRAVYEHDKGNAALCTEMSRNGFLFDVDHAKEMSDFLRLKEERLAIECAELTHCPDLNVLSVTQLWKALRGLGAYVCYKTDSGAASLGKDTLRAYAASANRELAEASLKVIEYRGARKCRSTYLDKIRVHSDNRVRASWLSYGTLSGRWSAQGPNLANLPSARTDPTIEMGGVRSCYIVGAGRKLVSFDISQCEFRIAAYWSNDPAMIASCAPGEDVHTANARRLFGAAFEAADKAGKKSFRDLAKKSVFAACYLAEALTVLNVLLAEGKVITLQQVESVLKRVQAAWKVYYQKQAESLDLTIRRGYVESPILGRKRWLGFTPSPPENANFPIQSGAADAMNLKLQEIVRLRDAARLDAKLVAMVYDAGYFDTAEKDVAALQSIIRNVFAKPLSIEGREFVLPIDLKVGTKWSEC